jgi:hypothetical protein
MTHGQGLRKSEDGMGSDANHKKKHRDAVAEMLRRVTVHDRGIMLATGLIGFAVTCITPAAHAGRIGVWAGSGDGAGKPGAAPKRAEVDRQIDVVKEQVDQVLKLVEPLNEISDSVRKLVESGKIDVSPEYRRIVER